MKRVTYPMTGGILWALVRKEMHEYWSVLLLGCFIVGGMMVLGLRSRLFPDEIVVVISVMLAGGVIFPLLVAMGVVAPERAEGSVNTLLRLPVPGWGVLAVKTAVAMAIVLTPIVLALAMASYLAGDRELGYVSLGGLHFTGAMIAIHVLIWTVCVGIRQPSEARVGLVGIGLIITTFIVMMLCTMVFGNHWMNRVMPWTPFGFIGVMNNIQVKYGGSVESQIFATVWRQMMVLLVLLVLWIITAWRFSHPGRTRG